MAACRSFRGAARQRPICGNYSIHCQRRGPGWLRNRKRELGFLTLRPDSGYVDHLFVAQDWRLCGVGRGLLHVGREDMGQPLLLDVDAQNTAARDAYEALGWKVLAKAGEAGNEQIRLIGP